MVSNIRCASCAAAFPAMRALPTSANKLLAELGSTASVGAILGRSPSSPCWASCSLSSLTACATRNESPTACSDAISSTTSSPEQVLNRLEM